jgi:hypothetical protein
VKTPKKTTQTPSTKKTGGGGVETTKKDNASEKRPRKEKTKLLEKLRKKVIQPEVERHHKNANDPQSSSQARYTNETRTSEVPDNLVLGNHEA